MVKPKAIDRTSKGLSDALFEELDALRDGQVTPQHAQSFASLAKTICGLSKLEMNYARFVSDARADSKEVMRSLPMGSQK